jgi:predicted lipoprotein with Yx(FWY)xxD motif
MKRLIPPALAAVAIAVAVAGCGSSNSGGGGSATAASSPATPAIKTAKTSLGTFLVDGQGRTLYLFEADKPNMSTCSGGCLSIWPALSASGKPAVSGGVKAAKVGTTKTPDGTPIVTYNGHPLYTYAGDQKAGDVNGEGLNQFGAKWYVVKPSGEKIDDD